MTPNKAEKPTSAHKWDLELSWALPSLSGSTWRSSGKHTKECPHTSLKAGGMGDSFLPRVPRAPFQGEQCLHLMSQRQTMVTGLWYCQKGLTLVM